MKNAIFDSSLTDAQWDFLKAMLPKPSRRGRPPTDRRRILDAIFYLIKCGNPWRYLPASFPPWKTVYHVFRQWTLNHVWAAQPRLTGLEHVASGAAGHLLGNLEGEQPNFCRFGPSKIRLDLLNSLSKINQCIE